MGQEFKAKLFKSALLDRPKTRQGYPEPVLNRSPRPSQPVARWSQVRPGNRKAETKPAGRAGEADNTACT